MKTVAVAILLIFSITEGRVTKNSEENAQNAINIGRELQHDFKSLLDQIKQFKEQFKSQLDEYISHPDLNIERFRQQLKGSEDEAANTQNRVSEYGAPREQALFAEDYFFDDSESEENKAKHKSETPGYIYRGKNNRLHLGLYFEDSDSGDSKSSEEHLGSGVWGYPNEFQDSKSLDSNDQSWSNLREDDFDYEYIVAVAPYAKVLGIDDTHAEYKDYFDDYKAGDGAMRERISNKDVPSYRM